MGLLGAVDAKWWHVGSPSQATRANVRNGRVTRRRERVKRGDRGRIVDDALEARRQAEQLSQPPQHDLFQLRRSG